MKQSLKDIGYDDFFESSRKTLGFLDYPVARVVAESKGGYRVRDENKEYSATVTGKTMFTAADRADYPAVGDWVAVQVLGDDDVLIKEILPRKTVLSKSYSSKHGLQVIATNIDCMFVIESVDRDYNLNRFERYLVLAREGNIEPVLLLNKTDLILDQELADMLEEINRRFKGVKVITTSILNENGLAELRSSIGGGKTYCFVGSSGVGKSSLINKLLNTDKIKTKEISSVLNRGKHTTTSRQMYFLQNGGIVIDNPGIRAVGIANMKEGVEEIFFDVVSASKNCKYANCTHTHEPGCAVKESVERGEVSEAKYSNYLKLRKESEYYSFTEAEKRAKNRDFGRLIKNAQKSLR